MDSKSIVIAQPRVRSGQVTATAKNGWQRFGEPLPTVVLTFVLAVYVIGTSTETYQPTGIIFQRTSWLVIWATLVLVTAFSLKRLQAIHILAAAAIAAMLVTDDGLIGTTALNDLGLVRIGGENFTSGLPVYLSSVTPASSPLDYPYVYAPPTLPFAAVLAALPTAVADPVWFFALAAAALLALRLIGLRGGWEWLFLLWPPIFVGIFAGNIAPLLFLLFAAAPRVPAGLVVLGSFKLYQGVAGLWLIRTGKWRDIAIGLGVVLVALLVTIPLTGIDRWVEWWRGLANYQVLAQKFDGPYAGNTLSTQLPFPLFVVIAGAVTLAAFIKTGREGLARLGVASVVVSLSTHAHAFMTALPSMLQLRTALFWFAVGITSTPMRTWWWLAVGLTIAGWFVPWLRRPAIGDGSANPLGNEVQPWPDRFMERRFPAALVASTRPGATTST